MNQILEKISKTLQLGKNNSNENEAQTAILAAQRLMAKYHISQEEVDNFINENDREATQVIEEKAENEINNDKWKRKLLVTIAKNFRCDVYYHGGKLVLVGEKEDILITKRVYVYAKQSILSSFKEFFKENYEHQLVNSSIRTKCKREFAFGFIKGLSEKFEKQITNSELSLVAVNPNVEEYLSNINFSGTYHSRVSYITDNYCYEEGKRNGKKLADIDSTIEESWRSCIIEQIIRRVKNGRNRKIRSWSIRNE